MIALIIIILIDLVVVGALMYYGLKESDHQKAAHPSRESEHSPKS